MLDTIEEELFGIQPILDENSLSHVLPPLDITFRRTFSDTFWITKTYLPCWYPR